MSFPSSHEVVQKALIGTKSQNYTEQSWNSKNDILKYI